MSKPTVQEMLDELNKVITGLEKAIENIVMVDLEKRSAPSDEAHVVARELSIFKAIRALIENSDKGTEVEEIYIQRICEAMIKARSLGGEMWPILANWLREAGVRVKEGG